MAVIPPDHRLETVLGRRWWLYLIEGLVLIALGFLAILVPPLAGLALTVLFGWLILFSGVVGLVSTFWTRNAPSFFWSLLSAILGIVVGVMFLLWPASGAVSLTLLLVAFFLLEGIATIMFSLSYRTELPGRWGWLLVSGLVDLVLAGIVMAGLPGTASWLLGILVGINLTFGGFAMTTFAFAIKPKT